MTTTSIPSSSSGAPKKPKRLQHYASVPTLPMTSSFSSSTQIISAITLPKTQTLPATIQSDFTTVETTALVRINNVQEPQELNYSPPVKRILAVREKRNKSLPKSTSEKKHIPIGQKPHFPPQKSHSS